MSKVTIQKLQQKHFSQASICLAKGFLREPMTQVLKISLGEMQQFCEAVIDFAITNTKLSFVALNEDMNVVGVIINNLSSTILLPSDLN